MKIEELKSKGLDIEWNITVPADVINVKISEKYEKISSTIKLPGFRPGKVPINIIKQRYSKSIMPEVLDEVVNDTLKNAVVQKEIRPSVQPKVDVKKFEEGSELIFNVSFQIMPEIQKVDLKKITVEKPFLEIGSEDLERTLKELANKHERFEPLKKKRKSKKNDLILFDYKGLINGKEFKGNKGENETVVLGSNKYIPGYEDQMIGLELDQKKDITVTFPKDYRMKEIAGKNAIFSLRIKDIQERVNNIKIDNQLAEELGEKDLDSLKRKIEEKMNNDYEQYAKLKVRRELTDKILSLHKFDIPSRMVEDEVNFLKNQAKDKTDKEINNLAEKRVKLGLILNNIGNTNKIEVSDQDLTKAVAAEAQKYPGEEKKVVDFYKENPQMMNNLRGVAFEEKVIDFIANVCSVEKKKYTFDELFNTKELKDEKKLIGSNKKKEKKNE